MPDGDDQQDGAPVIDLKNIVPGDQANAAKDIKGTPVSVDPPAPLDVTRKKIAYALLGLLAGVILLQVIFGSVYSVGCWEGGAVTIQGHLDQCELATKSLSVMSASLNPVFTAMVGLVGSVVGFYFGSKST